MPPWDNLHMQDVRKRSPVANIYPIFAFLACRQNFRLTFQAIYCLSLTSR